MANPNKDNDKHTPSVFDGNDSRSFAIHVINEEEAQEKGVKASRNILGVLDKDFIVRAAVPADFLPPDGQEGVFYLLPDGSLWLFSEGEYICITADVDKAYVDAKFNAAVNESKEYTDSKLNYDGVVDVEVGQDPSTVTLTEKKKNLKTGVENEESNSFPVASSTQAGVLNAATYQGFVEAQTMLGVLMDGSILVEGLEEAPSQNDLTTAWKEAMGKEEVINRAYIWSPEYNHGYTYFSNVGLWYMTSSGGGSSFSVLPFTNDSLGTIKGSDKEGQVHAETDGTGSVNGWDALKDRMFNAESAILNKVDKEDGKGLSTEDFTTDEKEKLAGIEDGATKVILDKALDDQSENGVENKAIATEVNKLNTALSNKAAQSDLEALGARVATNEDAIKEHGSALESLNSEVSRLDNVKVEKEEGKGLSTNDFSNTDKAKLDKMNVDAEPNVQSDWGEEDVSADSYIKNKPVNVSSFANDAGYLTEVPSEYMTDKEVEALGYQTAEDVVAAIEGKADKDSLAKVATSGQYGDLEGIPTLADVATSGDYQDLKNLPDIPGPYELPFASAETLGGVKVGEGLVMGADGKLSTTGGGVADAVAWGHITGTLDDQKDLKEVLAKKVDSDSLAPVATSGNYNDLTGTPDIPTVNDGKLTIQKNKETVGEFSANSSEDKILNIEVPTKTSELDNDAGFLTVVESITNEEIDAMMEAA